jgi:hypothetical protein
MCGDDQTYQSGPSLFAPKLACTVALFPRGGLVCGGEDGAPEGDVWQVSL